MSLMMKENSSRRFPFRWGQGQTKGSVGSYSDSNSVVQFSLSLFGFVGSQYQIRILVPIPCPLPVEPQENTKVTAGIKL